MQNKNASPPHSACSQLIVFLCNPQGSLCQSLHPWHSALPGAGFLVWVTGEGAVGSGQPWSDAVTAAVFTRSWGEHEELSPALLGGVRVSWLCPPPVEDQAGAGHLSSLSTANSTLQNQFCPVLHFRKCLWQHRPDPPICGQLLSSCYLLPTRHQEVKN